MKIFCHFLKFSHLHVARDQQGINQVEEAEVADRIDEHRTGTDVEEAGHQNHQCHVECQRPE